VLVKAVRGFAILAKSAKKRRCTVLPQKSLALGRYQKCIPHVPGFLQARRKLSDVSQKKSQSYFCAQQIMGAPSHTATHDGHELSNAFSGPPPRGARPIGHFGCSTSGARAMCHTSRVDDQRAEPSPSPASADSDVRGGQRPVDLVLRAISERWKVHCEIIGNRSMFGLYLDP